MIRRLGWWIADYAYALRWQLGSVFAKGDAEALRTGAASPVVIIPGVYESWRFMLPLVRDLHARGHAVHVVDPLRNNRVPVPQGARLVAAYLEEHAVEGALIVAHSKGGLIGKHLMTFGAAAPRIRSMVAIAAPFGGSRYARYLLGSTLRSFSPRDPTLRRLAAEAQANARIVSVFAGYDPHIPEGSELLGATNVRVATGGHFRILAHPETLAVVHRAASLDEAAEAQPPPPHRDHPLA